MYARLMNSRLSTPLTKLYFQIVGLGQRESHSVIEHFKNPNMDVKILPALQDNYMYLIVDKETKTAAVVDPVEPAKVLDAVKKMGANLTTVLTTHHHWDHAGGNEELVQMSPGLTVYGGDDRIGALTKKIGHGANFNIGNLHVNCLYTPCHTTGHICYHVTVPDSADSGVVFTGDTLFLGGCGRFFEGTAEQMYTALISVLSALPDSTKVFCGHEYTLSNLKFASQVEPDNEEVKKKISWSTDRRKESKPTVPSTIGEEKLYNPFMRVVVPAVMQYANTNSPIDTMKVIRSQKDNFKG